MLDQPINRRETSTRPASDSEQRYHQRRVIYRSCAAEHDGAQFDGRMKGDEGRVGIESLVENEREKGKEQKNKKGNEDEVGGGGFCL